MLSWSPSSPKLTTSPLTNTSSSHCKRTDPGRRFTRPSLAEELFQWRQVEQIMDTETGLDLNEENVEKVLTEIRPYLAGTGGRVLRLVQRDGYVAKVQLSGPVAGVRPVRVALTQKLREKIPAIAAVQLLDQ